MKAPDPKAAARLRAKLAASRARARSLPKPTLPAARKVVVVKPRVPKVHLPKVRVPKVHLPKVPRAGRKGPQGERRRPWWLLLLLLLVLLLAWFCCCGSPPVPELAAEPEAVGDPLPAAPVPAPPAPLEGRVDPKPRPRFETPQPTALPWLPSFRLQVSARSPRLAACFVGAARPGTLRWTAEVEPVSGEVSDHELEPTLLSDPLTAEQRACVLDVLSDPPYVLEADERATPSRVGVALQF